jgi:hypothetical protein
LSTCIGSYARASQHRTDALTDASVCGQLGEHRRDTAVLTSDAEVRVFAEQLLPQIAQLLASLYCRRSSSFSSPK